MEIVKHYPTYTMWKSEDAEGKKTYAVTNNQNGVASEPRAAAYYSQAAALKSFKEDKIMAEYCK